LFFFLICATEVEHKDGSSLIIVEKPLQPNTDLFYTVPPQMSNFLLWILACLAELV